MPEKERGTSSFNSQKSQINHKYSNDQVIQNANDDFYGLVLGMDKKFYDDNSQQDDNSGGDKMAVEPLYLFPDLFHDFRECCYVFKYSVYNEVIQKVALA